jgi:REP element-mobilizing transposase RayT
MILVATAFGESVIEKNWPVLAATVHPTHTHVVFATLADPIQRVIATLKSRSARRVLALRRQMRCTVGRSLWTEGQFAVFIYSERHLQNAIEYVRRHNDRIGRPQDAYPWVQSLATHENPARERPAYIAGPFRPV